MAVTVRTSDTASFDEFALFLRQRTTGRGAIGRSGRAHTPGQLSRWIANDCCSRRYVAQDNSTCADKSLASNPDPLTHDGCTANIAAISHPDETADCRSRCKDGAGFQQGVVPDDASGTDPNMVSRSHLPADACSEADEAAVAKLST